VGDLAAIGMMFTYIRARVGGRRSEAGIITMEFLAWSFGALIIGGAIVALIYSGWLTDANDIRRSPRPTAPAP
jgi:hypothetical protein